MIIDEIKELAKLHRVMVFFDMDGTCAEYASTDKPRILSNEPKFYFEKRPLKSVLKVMKQIFKIKNVTVGILTNCHFKEQKLDKIAWLKKYAPYIEENFIQVNVFNEINFEDKDKYTLKAMYLKNLMDRDGDTEYYLFEDDHRIMKTCKNVLPKLHVEHVSRLIA